MYFESENVFYRRSTYNHLSSWLTDARNLTNPNTVSIAMIMLCVHIRDGLASVQNFLYILIFVDDNDNIDQ